MASHDNDTVLRHAGFDRAFHWINAVVVLLLMVTGLLPVLGVNFAWVKIHWISGVLLTALIVLHIVRALFWQSVRTIALGGSGGLPGKYTMPQKLMHLGWMLTILVVIITGWFLMKKAGVPFFERDPYALSLRTWGVMTLLHDLASLAAVFLLLVHVYFGLLPEKREYLRAMLTGRASRAVLAQDHDLEKVERGE